MDTQNTLDSIPTDLLHEILSRLPIKMVGRCRCVSKIMASRLGSEDFKQLFLTRSVTRPRLLMAVCLFCPVRRNNEDYAFYSLPQPQNSYEKSCLVVRPDFHMKFPCSSRKYFMYASGLFYFSDRCISTSKVEEDNTSRVICNPITGQYVILPKLRTDKEPPSFLGFDPIDKQFKLLLINARVNEKRSNFILTLESGKMKWRTIKCPLLSTFSRSGICINGVLYYLARDIGTSSYVIVCFDVRTETFKFKPIIIDLQHIISRRLINYKGKLGIVILREKIPDHRVVSVELSMLVLEDEDVEKQEWLKYTLPRRDFGSYIYVVGMTSTDDIVLSTISNRLFYVYYFNPRRNSLQNVEVQNFKYVRHGTVHVFMDHVEDLYVNDVKHLKSNVYADLREARRIKFESTNAFEALCLSDEEDEEDDVIA